MSLGCRSGTSRRIFGNILVITTTLALLALVLSAAAGLSKRNQQLISLIQSYELTQDYSTPQLIDIVPCTTSS